METPMDAQLIRALMDKANTVKNEIDRLNGQIGRMVEQQTELVATRNQLTSLRHGLIETLEAMGVSPAGSSTVQPSDVVVPA